MDMGRKTGILLIDLWIELSFFSKYFSVGMYVCEITVFIFFQNDSSFASTSRT
jgi:hypothetical protein